jgi:hypothetical protein
MHTPFPTSIWVLNSLDRLPQTGGLYHRRIPCQAQNWAQRAMRKNVGGRVQAIRHRLEIVNKYHMSSVRI